MAENANDLALALASGNSEAINIASRAYNTPDASSDTNTDTATSKADQSAINANNASAAASAAQEAYYNNLGKQDRESASAFLSGILKQYNLGALAGQLESLVQQWGNNQDVIALKLKETQPYKDRFKGLLTLQQRGQNDVINEAQYLQLESDYRAAFRDAGLTTFLGDAGSQSEYDKIAKLASDYSVSVNEVKSRIADAQRVVQNTPDEVKSQLQNYYGIDPSTLVEYSLDKTQTQDRINTMANAAIAGGYAAKAGLNISQNAAEQVSTLSQGNDISVNQLTNDVSNAKDVQDATGRLAEIDHTTLSNDESLLSSLNLDQNAATKVKQLQSRERARFDGKNAIDNNTLYTNSGF